MNGTKAQQRKKYQKNTVNQQDLTKIYRTHPTAAEFPSKCAWNILQKKPYIKPQNKPPKI